MADGFRWLRVQLREQVYEQARRSKGKETWDAYVERLLSGTGTPPVPAPQAPVGAPAPVPLAPTPPSGSDAIVEAMKPAAGVVPAPDPEPSPSPKGDIDPFLLDAYGGVPPAPGPVQTDLDDPVDD